MFLEIIFRKYRLSQNKFFIVSVYGLAYFLIVFIVLSLAYLYLGRFSLQRVLLISVISGIMMAISYLIRMEFFKLKQ
jgi:hypothetical protein